MTETKTYEVTMSIIASIGILMAVAGIAILLLKVLIS